CALPILVRPSPSRRGFRRDLRRLADARHRLEEKVQVLAGGIRETPVRRSPRGRGPRKKTEPGEDQPSLPGIPDEVDAREILCETKEGERNGLPGFLRWRPETGFQWRSFPLETGFFRGEVHAKETQGDGRFGRLLDGRAETSDRNPGAKTDRSRGHARTTPGALPCRHASPAF